MAEHIQHAQKRPWPLVGQPTLGHFVPDRHAQAVEEPLDPHGILNPYLNVRADAFPKPGWSKKNAGADLSDVIRDGFQFFGEIHRESLEQMPRHCGHLLPDPRERQKRHMVVGDVCRIDLIVIGCHLDHVPMSQHGAFGQAGGS